jgi:hypothetical protein
VLEYIQDLAKPERARITNIEALDQVEHHGFDAIRVAEELPPHASWDEVKKAYDEGFRAGKEIIAAEFRTASELNQPYVWKPSAGKRSRYTCTRGKRSHDPGTQRTRDRETGILGEGRKLQARQIALSVCTLKLFYKPFFKLGVGLNPTVRLALILIAAPV